MHDDIYNNKKGQSRLALATSLQTVGSDLQIFISRGGTGTPVEHSVTLDHLSVPVKSNVQRL